MFNFFKKHKERSELLEKTAEIRDKTSEKLIEGSKLSQQVFIALSENNFKEAEDLVLKLKLNLLDVDILIEERRAIYYKTRVY